MVMAFNGSAAFCCRCFVFMAMASLAISLQQSSSSPHRQPPRRQVLQMGQREIIEWDAAPPGVAWVVQLSDLHVSAFHPDRALSLKRLVAPALQMIRPALVLITGDLTDAKNKERTLTRQDEAEWREYNETIEVLCKVSGMEKYAFFDLRGNHDKYGVPCVGSHWDFFSRYSISTHFNRTSLVHSVTVVGQNRDKFLFVGLDNSMSIGLRGPSNLFGHQTDEMLLELDLELSQWDNDAEERVPKIVFGHFPTSFITSTETLGRVEDLFSKHSVTAYICGHLHSKFGRQLYNHHFHSSLKNKEFWEWEIGDWRNSRIMRVLAIDKGSTSFVDIDLSNVGELSSDFALPVIIVPTFPLNSQTMQRATAYHLHESADQTSIRALVFSQMPIISVTAKIFDSSLGLYGLVEEIELHASVNSSNVGPHYRAVWDIKKYSDPSATRFWLQIFATDVLGNQSASLLQPFSVDGRSDPLKWTWVQYLVIGVRWENLYFRLLWGAVSLFLVLLIFPKISFFYLKKRGLYDKWVVSILNPSHGRTTCTRVFFLVPLWALVEGSRNRMLWYGQLFYMMYLLLFPWFSGNVLADDYPNGSMYIWGWTVRLSPSSSWQSGLGVPDIMAIVIPFFYLVLLPSLLIMASLSAESAAWKCHAISKFKCCQKKDVLSYVKSKPHLGGMSSTTYWRELPPEKLQFEPDVLVNDNKLTCKVCQGWIRVALILGALGIIFLHWRQCRYLAGAYGSKGVLTSLGFVWPVPLLYALVFFQTSGRRTPSV